MVGTKNPLVWFPFLELKLRPLYITSLTLLFYKWESCGLYLLGYCWKQIIIISRQQNLKKKALWFRLCYEVTNVKVGVQHCGYINMQKYKYTSIQIILPKKMDEGCLGVIEGNSEWIIQKAEEAALPNMLSGVLGRIYLGRLFHIFSSAMSLSKLVKEI